MNRRMQAKVDETAAAQGAICALAECQDWAELGSLARSSIDNRGIDRKMLAAIEQMHDRFAQNVTDRLGAPADVAFIDYTTVCEVLLSLGRPSHSFRCAVQGTDGPFVIDMGPRLAQELADDGQRVAEHLLTDLLSIWPQTLTLQNPTIEVFSDPFAMGMGKLYDTCVLTGYEVKTGGDAGGLLSLCYPEPSIADLLTELGE
jgi:flagellar motor switch protein FliM